MNKNLISTALALSALFASSCASTAAFPKMLPDSGFVVAAAEIADADELLVSACGGAAAFIAALPFAELSAALEEAAGLRLESAHITAQSAAPGCFAAAGTAAAQFDTDAAQTAEIRARLCTDGTLLADIALFAPGKDGRKLKKNCSVRIDSWMPRRIFAAEERAARVSFGEGVCVRFIDGEPFAAYARDNAAEDGSVFVESGRKVAIQIVPVVPANGITAGTELPAQTVEAEFASGGKYIVRLEADRSEFFKTDWTARIIVEEREPSAGF